MVVWIAVLVLALQEQQEPMPALYTLDPVELVAGREVPGSLQHLEDRNGFRYLFSSDENGEIFEHDPRRFEIQMGGACAAEGPLGEPGDRNRFLVHDGRIYIFESEACREAFRASPERFVDHDELPLQRERNGELARGRALLAKVVAGLGGTDALDGLTNLSLCWEFEPLATECGQLRWSQQVDYNFALAGGLEVTRSTTANLPTGEATVREQLSGDVVRKSTVVKRPETLTWVDQRNNDSLAQPKPVSWAARYEFDVQTGRELVFLLRQRDKGGLTAWSDGAEVVNGRELERLVLNWNARNTTLSIDPESGRVLRARWRGRSEGTGPNQDVSVDFDDFKSVAGLVLPLTRKVSHDGKMDDPDHVQAFVIGASARRQR